MPNRHLDRLLWWKRAPPEGDLCLQLAGFPERNTSPVLLVSSEPSVLYANEACHHVLTAEGLPPTGTTALLPPTLGEELRWAAQHGSHEIVFEHRVGTRLFQGRANLIDEGRQAHLYLTDVTESREMEIVLDRIRRFDPLTGLLNRASFEDRLSQALSDADDRAVAVFLIEFDRLGPISDTLGQPAVNAVLRGASARMATAIHGDGARVDVFRYRDQTLAGLMTGIAGEGDPARLAGRLVAALGQPYEFQQAPIFATVSVGLAIAPADGQGLDGMLRSAQMAVSRAIAAGGNTFRCHTAEMDAMARDWRAIETGLRTALRDDTLALAYQPQFRLSDMKETGQEALLRWSPPEAAGVGIERVIAVAEASGLILGEGGLGAWALARACADAVRGTGDGSIAVNVSARQFHEPGFPRLVSRVLQTTGIAPARLDLEITETVAMEEAKDVQATLGELKDLGVCLSIDDFGVGYSSLNSLRRFPIDRLKIDRSFVADLGQGSKDDGVTRAVIDLGHRLGLKVLAEGVETAIQLALLNSWGCDEAQGYLLGRPQVPLQGSR